MPRPSTCVKWDTIEPWRRLVVCILATKVKLDTEEIALHFGCSYDTIENALRKPRQEAKLMQALVKEGKVSPVKPRATASASGRGKKADGFAFGRVTKPSSSSTTSRHHQPKDSKKGTDNKNDKDRKQQEEAEDDFPTIGDEVIMGNPDDDAYALGLGLGNGTYMGGLPSC